MTPHQLSSLQRINTSAAIIAAIILVQTLYFKFTAQPESVMIFSILGVEPWGRITTGVLELISAILILVPRTRLWGALGVCAIMIGAIGSHLLVIGTNGMQSSLFGLAIVALVCAIIAGGITFYLKRQKA